MKKENNFFRYLKLGVVICVLFLICYGVFVFIKNIYYKDNVNSNIKILESEPNAEGK